MIGWGGGKTKTLYLRVGRKAPTGQGRGPMGMIEKRGPQGGTKGCWERNGTIRKSRTGENPE